MQTILVAGAGKSSIYLIEYLLENASRNKWHIIVADGDADAIARKIGKHSRAEAAVIDINKKAEREPLVKRADIVLSLMPPHLHILLAKDCLKYNKNLITSSYISDEMKEMDAEVKAAGLMFMCEMGLDPGIDHMTASKIINSIRKVAGLILSFKSYCGGLIAPESDTNPWHYKFSWNPRNIINAGMDGAHYLQNGKNIEVPYAKMFENNKKIKIPGLNALAYYPNRDSLKYLELYDVPEIKTFMRATLRYPAFCRGWNALMKLGLINDTDQIDTTGLTYTAWVQQKIGYRGKTGLEKHVAEMLGLPEGDPTIGLLVWLGIFTDESLPGGVKSSSDILLELLLRQWKMNPADKDMVVMEHEIEYEHKGRMITLSSSMVLKGDGGDHTAMAKTVGLPMGILASLVLGGKLKPPVGVVLPVMQSVYRPVLRELEHFGIIFKDEVR
jgi:saccharopine dehydrogenase-like NADP-dependent oxidoreductase